MEISARWGWQACPAVGGCSGAARANQWRPLPMLPTSLPLTSSDLEVDAAHSMSGQLSSQYSNRPSDTVRRPLKEAFLSSKIVILDYFSRELPF